MMAPVAHSVLRKADGGELVVAADFGTAGRPSATFTELVAGLQAEHNIWETMPPPHGDEAGMTGRQYVARWARDIRDGALPVRAVIGFCSGSVYAGALIQQISWWQDPPPLVLIDPDGAQRHMVTDHYERFMRARLTPVLSPAEVEEGVRAGRDADESAAGPLELAANLGALCQRILPPACRRAGLTGERSAELARVFASYLHWLAAASQLDVRAVWSSATALNSNTPGFGLDAFPVDERDGLVARVINLDVPHLELMRTPEAARIVDELLR
jgi:hypothetical protein